MSSWIISALASALVVALLWAWRANRRYRDHVHELQELTDGYEKQAIQADALAAQEAAASAHWEERFWSLHATSTSLIGERDAIKAIYRQSVNKHLEGQAILGQSLTRVRASAVALVKLVNEERERRAKVVELLGPGSQRVDVPQVVAKAHALCNAAPLRQITDEEIEALDAYPRGLVEAYYEQIKSWANEVIEVDRRLERELRDDRAKWDEHYRALAASARGGPPPLADKAPSLARQVGKPGRGASSPSGDELDGVTVQEVVPLRP